MSLDACIKKMGKALSQNDADAIRAIADAGLGDVQAIEQFLADMPVTLAQGPVNMHGVPVQYTVKSRGKTTGKSSVTKVLNPRNVEAQTTALQALADKNPDPLASEAAWLKFERQLLGVNQTPRAPTEMIRQVNDMDSWANEFNKLTHHQREAAGEGFAMVDEMKDLYEDGQATVHTTGKLMLWGMMSRMLSAHPHESAFLDAAMNERLNEFIDTAVTREWTDADVSEYLDWVKTVIPDFAPGKQGTSNLNDFGKIFLKKMSQRGDDGISKLQHLHDMIADHSIPSSDVRRAYYGLNEGMGIQNKVLSFVMLMTGRTDVVVLDRIQINKMWDAGRYGKLIYDDIATLFEGAHGLARYEALERSLLGKVGELYDAVGRPGDASVGRYHWESWVLNSGQVVAHPTMQGLINETKGQLPSPYADITAPEGRFHQFAFGSTYGRSADGTPYILYPNSRGDVHTFGLKEFKTLMKEIKKPGNKIIPKKMIVEDPGPNPTGATEVTQGSFSVKLFRDQGYPWYEAYGVDRGKIDTLISTLSEGRANDEQIIQQAAPVVARPDRRVFAAGRSDLRNDGASQLYSRESDPGITEDGVLLAEYTPGPELTQLLEESQMPAVVLQELVPTPGNAAVFRQAITDAKTSSEHGAAVYVYDANEYQGMRLFMTPDKMDGFAIKSDGDIVSVFSAGGGKVHSMLELAIDQGGNKLDAFDTVLPRIYEANGFREVSRDNWDDKYTPEGWDKETFSEFNDGEPAVVYMQYQAEPTVLYQPKRSARLGILGTYSSVGKTVDEMKLPQWKKEDGVANGTELWNKIRKSPGVKAEELKWLGLEEYLTSDPKAKFTKREVQAFILQRGVQVHETVADKEAGDQDITWEVIDTESGEEMWEGRATHLYTEWKEHGEGLVDFLTEYEIQKGWEKFEPFILQRASDAAKVAIEAADGVRDKIAALYDHMDYDSVDVMMKGNTKFTDLAMNHADEIAKFEYFNNPSQVHETSAAPGVYIVGPRNGVWDIRVGNVYMDNIVSEGISSFGEAQVLATQEIEEDELWATDTSPDADEIAKWGSFVMDGPSDNYREVKLTLPNVSPDDPFRNDTHFADNNVVAFLRVNDRDLTNAPRPTHVVSDAELNEHFETITPADYEHFEPRVRKTVMVAMPADDVGYFFRQIKGYPSKYVGDPEGAATWASKGGILILPREDAVAKETYFIDEFQSDWHQGGREHGYKTGKYSDTELNQMMMEATNEGIRAREMVDDDLPYNEVNTKAMRDLGALGGMADKSVDTMKGDYYSKGVWSIITGAVDGTNSESFNRKAVFEIIKTSPELLKAAETYAAAKAKDKVYQAETVGVPDAPFKGDAWMNMGLKRALIQAAEQGYEQLAWVNGPVLEQRWSEDFAELYKIQYDQKMPSFIKKLTGQKPRQFTRRGIEIHPVKGKPKTKDEMNVLETDAMREIEDLLTGEGVNDFDDNISRSAKTLIKHMRGTLPDISMYGDQQRYFDTYVQPNLDTLPQLQEYLDAYPKPPVEGYWIIELPPELRDKIQAEGYSLFQENRASIELQQNNQRLITLGKTSDPSSFLHESAHLFLELEKQLSREFGQQDHTAPLLDWLGVDSFDDIGVEEHEKFAETFEVYLETGKAPSLGLREAFAAFRRWLTAVYRSLDPRTRADLTPEIQEYFDRMLASEAEIEQLAGNPAYDQFFRDQESSGMTDAEWAKYQERKLKAKDKAINTLDQKLVGELTRRKTRDWKNEKEPIVEEEKERLRKEPVYQVLSDLAIEPMDYEAVKELNGGKIPGKMIGKAKKGGMHPDMYADVHGFASAAQMIKAINEAPTLNKAADAAAEAIMIERHGDILNDGSIEQEARDAMHSEEQAKVLLAELKALDKTTPIDLAYLKSEAKRLIGSLKYKEIKPGKYYRAEIKAAKKAATATTDAEKFEAKSQQAANHFLYKEAMETKDRMDRHRKYVKSAQTRKYNAKQVEPSYIANIKTIANMYDMRANTERVQDMNVVINWFTTQMMDENKYVDVTMLDLNILEAVVAKDASPDKQVPADFKLPQFDDLTAEQLRSVHDQIKHLRFVGGVMSADSTAEKAAKRVALSESILDNGRNDSKSNPGFPTRFEAGRNTFWHFLNSVVSLRNMTRKMDNEWKGAEGVAYDLIYADVEEATNNLTALKHRMYEVYTEKLNEMHKAKLSRKDGKDYTLESGRVVNIASEQRFMMAVYWGTESSREALRVGQDMTDNDVARILKDLTPAQLALVNGVWEVNETLWPELSKTSTTLYGVAPAKLDATPFVVNGTTMTGGHMRLFYDSSELALRTEQASNGSQSNVMPTKAGSLHSRVGSGGRPPALDISNIIVALDESMHFIAFAETGNRLHGLIDSNEVKGAIEKKFGKGFYKALIDNVDGKTANRSARETAPGLSYLARLGRKSTTMMYLAWNIKNTMEGMGVLPQAMDEAGYRKFMANAIKLYPKMLNPGNNETEALILEKSRYMRDRGQVINREAAETVKQLTSTGEIDHMWKKFQSMGFTPQIMVDKLFSYPVWLAGYDTAMEDPGMTETRAVSIADTAVAESIGSGSDLHLGGVFASTQSQWVKLFTMMGSWFNMTFNRMYRSAGGGTKFDAGTARTVLLTPLLTAALSAIIVGRGPDDDESWLEWLLWEDFKFLGASVPIVRDIASLVESGRSPGGTSVTNAAVSPIKAVRAVAGAVMDDDTSVPAGISRTIKATGGFVPIPFGGNITRVLDFWDANDGGPSDPLEMYRALTMGREAAK